GRYLNAYRFGEVTHLIARLKHLEVPDNHHNMSDEINYPTGFSLKDIAPWGNSGMICLDESSQTIVKSPHGGSPYSHTARHSMLCKYLHVPFSASIARNMLRVRSVIRAASEAVPPAIEAIFMYER